MARFRVPPWLRRSLEAAIVAGIVAVGSLIGSKLSTTSLVVLPAGVPGAILLAPSVLALGVIPAAYPMALAPTRMDAVFGSIAAFVIAADASVVLAAGPLALGGSALQLPAGFVAVLLAGAPAMVGIAAGQLVTPLGFGRHAGAVGAVVAAAGALAALAVLALIVSPAG